MSDEPGAHQGPRRPGRAAARFGTGLLILAVAAADLWFYFFALDGLTGDLDERWSNHPRLLVVAGWLPAGGFLVAGAAVALRLEHVRREGRKFGKVEENLYGWGGIAWFGLTSLMVGKQGRYDYDPDAVIDRVAHISEAVSMGVAAGMIAVLVLLPLMVAGFWLGRLLRVPRPGWPLTRTVASWFLGASGLGLLLALLSVPPGP